MIVLRLLFCLSVFNLSHSLSLDFEESTASSITEEFAIDSGAPVFVETEDSGLGEPVAPLQTDTDTDSDSDSDSDKLSDSPPLNEPVVVYEEPLRFFCPE